jgi:hypothetical protein
LPVRLLHEGMIGVYYRDWDNVRKMLGLDPPVKEFKVVYGVIAEDDKEIALLTRSMLQITVDLSSTIDVPQMHVADKPVAETFREKAPDGTPLLPLAQIHSSVEKPRDTFIVVPFRDDSCRVGENSNQ